MSIEEKHNVHPCTYCNRDYCVNRGDSSVAKPNYSCYQKSKCFDCVARNLCMNPSKGKIRRNIDIYIGDIEKIFNIKDCFIAPKSCKECSMACLCQNRNLKDVKFTLDLSKSSEPKCFSRYHSTK